MARGPQRKPAEIEAKLGHPRKQQRKVRKLPAGYDAPSSETAPQSSLSGSSTATTSPPDALTTAPADISPLAVPHWDHLAATLVARQVLRRTDVDALARYCEYSALWRAIRTALSDTRAASGLRVTYTTRSKHGSMTRLRPEWKALLDVERELRLLGDRFGLTPTTRAALFARIADSRDPEKPPQAPGLGSVAAPSDVPAAAPDGAQLPPRPASPIGHLGRSRNLN